MKCVLAFLSVVVPLSLGQSCPDGWVHSLSSCYQVSATDNLNFYGAQQYCAELGGFLAEITSEDEQAALFGFVSSDQNIWLGASDAASEGQWVWQHSFSALSYAYWYPGEPNDGGDGNEDCAYIRAGYGLQWFDTPCDRTNDEGNPFHAFCEIDDPK